MKPDGNSDPVLPTVDEILAGTSQGGVPVPKFLRPNEDDGTIDSKVPADLRTEGAPTRILTDVERSAANLRTARRKLDQAQVELEVAQRAFDAAIEREFLS